MNIGTHFSLEDLCHSPTAVKLGLKNEPGTNELANLVLLGRYIMDPLWDLWGGYHLNSGYRTLAVNVAVGSKAKASAHIDGRAVDVTPSKVLLFVEPQARAKALRAAFDELRASTIPYDQIIIENNRWIHVAMARVGVQPRRQTLVGVLHTDPKTKVKTMKYIPA